MIKKSFCTSIDLEKPSADVFRAITEDVPKWWGGNDLKGNHSKLKDEFIIHHPGAHFSKQRLIEAIPGKRLVWLVTESKLDWLEHQQEWTDTRMIFEITEKAGKASLLFTHEGLDQEKECYSKCAEGWALVIKDWLFNFINAGNAHFISANSIL